MFGHRQPARPALRWAYVATDRLARISERGIEDAPTLAVEIVSPSTQEIDRATKLRLYAGFGVPWYWIVDPDARVVEVYGLVESRYVMKTSARGDETLSAEPVADLAIPLASLWA